MKCSYVTGPQWMGAVLLVALAGCSDDKPAGDPNPASQALVDRIGADLKVNVTIIDNAPTKVDGTPDCPKDAPGNLCFSGKLVLSNTGTSDWTGGFAIYYSSIRKGLSTDTDQLTITHVNGDLHRIEPTAAFTAWKAGETKEIPFKAEFWLISETDVMPRFYVTADGAQAALIKSTDVADVGDLVTPLADPRIMKRTPGDLSVFA